MRVKSLYNRITLGSMVEDLIYLIFGIFLVTKTIDTSIFLIRIFGFILLISALCSLIRYMFKSIAKQLFNISIIAVVVKFLLAFIILIKPDLIRDLLAISIGIVLLGNGLIKLYYAFTFYNNQEEIWSLIGVISVGLILMGLSLLIEPLTANMIITRVCGVFMIIYSIVDCMQWMLFRKRCKYILRLFYKET